MLVNETATFTSLAACVGVNVVNDGYLPELYLHVLGH